MSGKKLIIRDKESSPPTSDQLDYLYKKKAEIIETKSSDSNRRIAVQISSSAFVLCDPEEKERYNKKVLQV